MKVIKQALFVLCLLSAGLASATVINFNNVDTAGWNAAGLDLSTPDGFVIGGCGNGQLGCLGDYGFNGVLTGNFVDPGTSNSTSVNFVEMLFCRGCGSENTTVSFFDSANALLGSINILNVINPPRLVTFSAADISGFTIDLGFDAIESIEFISNDVAAVPEPTTLVLFGLGLVGFGLSRKIKK